MYLKPKGLSVRSVESISLTKWPSIRRAKIPCMPRERGAMIGSRVATVRKQSQFSGRRLKLQRRSYWGLNVLSPTAGPRGYRPLRDANILNSEEIRRERAKWSSSKLWDSFVLFSRGKCWSYRKIACMRINTVIFFFFLKHLYWSIIALQWCVSFCSGILKKRKKNWLKKK